MKLPMMKCSPKTMAIVLGAIGGIGAIGVAAFLAWNSKQMRTARVLKRASKVLYRVGSAMQSVSGVCENC